jgi:type IV secretory pathway VirB10-like protein
VRNLSRDSRVRFHAPLEVIMPFSMATYFAGVGTVVGALALGFGSGIVLTNTAIKDTPAGPTRIERVARREPIAAPPPVVEAKAVALLTADSAPAVKPVSAIQPQPAVAEVPKESHYVREVEQPRQAELTKQTEQMEAEQRRATERRIDRHRRYAERKAREVAAARMKQRQWEEQGGAAKPELAYDRVEEPHFNLFENLSAPLRDRPGDVAPVFRRN